MSVGQFTITWWHRLLAYLQEQFVDKPKRRRRAKAAAQEAIAAPVPEGAPQRIRLTPLGGPKPERVPFKTYRHRETGALIQARCMDRGFSVTSPAGEFVGVRGDYATRVQGTGRWGMSAAEFEAQFEPVEG